MRDTLLAFVYILCCFSTESAYAQQIYQSGDYGGPGTQQLYSRHLTGFSGEEIRAAGADTIWDIQELIADDLILSEIIPRDEAFDAFTFAALCTLSGIDGFTCLGIWTNTQQALLVQDSQTLIQFTISDLQRFQRKTNARLLETFLGFTIDLNGSPTGVAIVYQSPDTVLNFPVEYNDSHASRITWGVDLSATGQNIQYVSHQLRSSQVDAWGDLFTPYDTLHGVLRVRAAITRNDTLTSDSLSVPINLTQVEYAWYDTSYGIPVMTATGIVTDTSEIINTVSFLVEAECPNPIWTAETETDVYYVDDSGSALVQFTVEMNNAGIYTWNFDDGMLESSDGDIAHLYTSPGIYDVVVNGCMTNCLPLNSCTSQTLTIEVIDTTSAIHFPGIDELGIRIYPNPAFATVTIDVPATPEVLHYRFVDVHGRLLIEGELASGKNAIVLELLPDGLYALQLFTPLTHAVYAAERVMISH